MKKLHILKLICIVLIITVFCCSCTDNENVEVNIYNIPRYTIVSNIMYKSAESKISEEYKEEEPYIIDFPQNNIIAEFVFVSSRAMGDTPDNSSYYVVLYADKTLSFVKGCLAFGVGYINDDIEYELYNKYDYDNDDSTCLLISAYENYKSDRIQLTKKQYSKLIELLDTAEKYYPYSDKFASKTGMSYYGCYYNNHYYNILSKKTVEADEAINKLMKEVGMIINVNYTFNKTE